MHEGRTPVLVGVAQLEQRVDDPRDAEEPIQLMLRASEAAAEDAGSSALLALAQSVYVIKGIWPYVNAPGHVAERIGARGAATLSTPYGGNNVQSCVSDAARQIVAGETDIVLITGAEIGRTQARAARAGIRLDWTETEGSPDRLVGSNASTVHPAEAALRIFKPIEIYPIFENAIRNDRGESLEDHITRVSELWARFNAVAVENPHAWIREPIDARAIRTPSASNRMVGFPYTKLMNSNNAVDQAAALILCSLDRAHALGLDESRFVFPHAGTDAHDAYVASNRADLHSSPAIRIAGMRCLELAETDSGEIDYVDLYSCFPSAVQVAAEELGLCEDRPLTVTGGLTFGGGPLNNYVMHAIARMADVLRDAPGTRGLVTANGGNLAKHAFGVYSTEPPPKGFRYADLQTEVDAQPGREVTQDHVGPVTVESYTAMYDADGPATAVLACLTDAGQRCWATSSDRGLARAVTEQEFCGERGERDHEGGFRVH